MSLTYSSWKSMRARCSPTGSPSLTRRYAQRGIGADPRWADFEVFLQDVGERPSKAHSLERIDNDGHYEPGNVRWATGTEQQRNRSNNRFIEVNGERLCVTDWAIKLGIDPRRIFERLRRGWSPNRAVSVKYATRWSNSSMREERRRMAAKRFITYRGETLSISEWAERLGLRPKVVAERLRKGWSEERAVTTISSSRWGEDVRLG